MPMLGVSFSELKKVIGLVAILLVVTFIVGFSAGYTVGKGNDPATLANEKKEMERNVEKIFENSNNNSSFETPSERMRRLTAPNSNSEATKQLEREMQKLLDEYDKAQSQTAPSPKPSSK